MAQWARADYAAMHAELTAAARRARPLAAFEADLRRAAATATATQLSHGPVGDLRDGVVNVPTTVTTRAFGAVRATLRLPFAGEGDDARIDWSPYLSFPGVRRGERLARTTRLAPRAAILARDDTPLAQGDDRSSPLGPATAAIAGDLEAPQPERVKRLRALGIPDDAPVGSSASSTSSSPVAPAAPCGQAGACWHAARPRPPRPCARRSTRGCSRRRRRRSARSSAGSRCCARRRGRSSLSRE
jgi:hypothetical protein